MANDYRCFNKRGGPAYQHKMRVVVGTNKNPIAYGITIPAKIAQEFSGCYMLLKSVENGFLLESGCKLSYNDKMLQVQTNTGEINI